LDTTCTSADLILFMLLTGCRVGESRTLTWSCVDLDAKVPTFTIPPEIAKNHEELRLPISKPLFKVLKRRLQVRRKKSDFVFPAKLGNTGHISDPRSLFKKVSAVAGENVSPRVMYMQNTMTMTTTLQRCYQRLKRLVNG